MTPLRFTLAVLTCASAAACDGPRPTLLPGAWHVVETRNATDHDPIKVASDTCLTRPMTVEGLGLVALVDESPDDHCRASEVWGIEHGVDFRLMCEMGGERRGEIEGTIEMPVAGQVSVRATIMRTRGYGPVASKPLIRDFTRTGSHCPASAAKTT